MLGEDPKDTPNNIFPLITNTALGIQKNLIIYGNDWPTPDGTHKRLLCDGFSFLHIKVLEF